jgi:hypothetical protein
MVGPRGELGRAAEVPPSTGSGHRPNCGVTSGTRVAKSGLSRDVMPTWARAAPRRARSKQGSVLKTRAARGIAD